MFDDRQQTGRNEHLDVMGDGARWPAEGLGELGDRCRTLGREVDDRRRSGFASALNWSVRDSSNRPAG